MNRFSTAIASLAIVLTLSACSGSADPTNTPGGADDNPAAEEREEG